MFQLWFDILWRDMFFLNDGSHLSYALLSVPLQSDGSYPFILVIVASDVLFL